MSEDGDRLLEAIAALVPPLLNALEVLGFIARHLHPPELASVLQAVGERDGPLREALPRFQQVAWPEHLSRFRDTLEQASAAALQSFDGLRAAAQSPDGVMQAYRALRHSIRAVEALYPLAAVLPAVSRFYLEPGRRDDKDLLARLANEDRTREGIGVMQAGEDKAMRGGFSLYVPEYYNPEKPHPLVMALHGGSGNGGLFLWSWLREARSRGIILVSPTAVGDTWSLMQPELDSENIEKILGYVRQNWNVDAAHMLLTGMSDGGTFSLVSGLRAPSPFTHLAPIAASFHPFLLEISDAERLAGLPIYLVHGALDWMFPVAMARAAEAALGRAGAKVTYREIEDLSHTYPRDENPKILDWFLGSAVPSPLAGEGRVGGSADL